ncbi:MAG: DUF1350 family protein [Chloroflexales bacterium]|nr:DUF1350 family protein [Chloroflexales bacterium]
MPLRYTLISQSWVAQHPQPIGVVEFYGGEFFGLLPTTSYDFLLQSLFAAGYTIIAVPIQLGFDHYRIAYTLVEERDRVRDALPNLTGVPHFWVGHSVGCKFIALLEAFTDPATNTLILPSTSAAATLATRRGILDEPSLLMAPSIADTEHAVRVPILPQILDKLGLGVEPTKQQTQALIEQRDLFNLTALISFRDDTVAGNQSGSPEESDVAWFLEALRAGQNNILLHEEIEGDHLAPLGVQVGDSVYLFSMRTLLRREPVPRPLELLIIRFLAELDQRRRQASLVPVSSYAMSSSS